MESSFIQWLAEPALTHFLIVSAILFALGLMAVISKRNIIMVLMGVELILNSANINFVAFSRFTELSMEGQMIGMFIIIIAAAEAAVALAIVLNVFNRFKSINLDDLNILKG
ncbi:MULTISPECIES: NADH-quinone oxidoreductase subunit NuoK [Rhodohalobacter]|jgi:NADH-quinone oxidoreductase subunit K|uniref:NADH-quinone oxidoreductase subunit K n=1 Tax=Rhodohalobacter barkolensis TaxID=2053187 RepID=A0A2N0VL99_9BACT|nr:NADH-quinone oxidoreductase subunit NuoK [Rhodohalobacter barkolensis]PKD44975.1 NADH-quinone oxidoreductase subunit NuoK [Rhodohalobacter barkolensis]